VTAAPLAELLRAFLAVDREQAAALAAERADHAETAKLAEALRADLRRTKALLVESETVRRGQHDELIRLRAGAPDDRRLAAVAEAVADDLFREGRQHARDGGSPQVSADWLFGLAGRLRAALGRAERQGPDWSYETVNRLRGTEVSSATLDRRDRIEANP
jgi:hypothetical protein